MGAAYFRRELVEEQCEADADEEADAHPESGRLKGLWGKRRGWADGWRNELEVTRCRHLEQLQILQVLLQRRVVSGATRRVRGEAREVRLHGVDRSTNTCQLLPFAVVDGCLSVGGGDSGGRSWTRARGGHIYHPAGTRCGPARHRGRDVVLARSSPPEGLLRGTHDCRAAHDVDQALDSGVSRVRQVVRSCEGGCRVQRYDVEQFCRRFVLRRLTR